jgi:hypothetical protein
MVLADFLDRLAPVLGSEARTNNPFWAESALNAIALHRLQALAGMIGLEVNVATSDLAPGTASYAPSTPLIAVLAVTFAGSDLRPASIEEISALDDAWATRSGAPTRYLQEHQGFSELRLYPIPAVSGQLVVISFGAPSSFAAGLPDCVESVLAPEIVSILRDRDSDAAMPEVAKPIAQMAEQHRAMLAHYWGEVIET